MLLLSIPTESEWQEKLGNERYRVMRLKETQRAFSGTYVSCKREGTYCCAACDVPLFRSEDKYDIGCGWPTFTKPVESKAIYYLEDYSFVFKRYEVLCRSCGCHLGHVFRDGPPPKHLRYTINSISLSLKK